MDILRIATAGSVDDGKSTLIGRLLYDTKSVTKDKLEAIDATSKRKGLDFVDLSLLTDGLIAEREQGITIDVAHIYFATEKRKYIIADTPGHVEYTRNMITGASNAQSSIVLIDARNGVGEQTRRHLFISSLLRLHTVFVCINKMDLVGYDATVYDRIKKEMQELSNRIGFEGSLHFIPVAAKWGDNVVYPSQKMVWYSGKTLLDHLESLPVHKQDQKAATRFPVQYVIRPHSTEHHDFRGYAGRLQSGTIRKGDTVLALPSLKTAAVKAVHKGFEEVALATEGESITIELEGDVDISRGAMLVSEEALHLGTTTFTATLAWMDEAPLTAGKTLLLQHGVNRVKAKVTAIQRVLDINTLLPQEGVTRFALNDIGEVTIKTAKSIFADLYSENGGNGAFILIDEYSNGTVGVGFIESFS